MTIKKRIALSFIFMLTVPVMLMLLTGLFFQFYYFGFSSSAGMHMEGWRDRNGVYSVRRPFPAAGVFFIGGFGVFLLAANGILSWTVSRSILRPLRRMELAARKIKDGDLSPSPGSKPPDRMVPSASGSDEFQRVIAAFEEMRSRLQISLSAQLAEENNRRELIASISHDLRTPLSAITGYVEGLRDGVADTPEKKERYLGIIESKVKLMDRLVDDLSIFSRLETGTIRLDPRMISFDSFLRELIVELAYDYPELEIRMDVCDPAVLSIDAAQFKRVVTNIVQNAARYANTGVGRPAAVHTLIVDSRIAAEPAPGNVIAAGVLTISFTDNGPGISDADLPYVFDRFYRADKARNQEKGGHGLGLSIAKMIVEAHGGDISAEHAPQGGACIRIRIPLAHSQNGALHA